MFKSSLQSLVVFALLATPAIAQERQWLLDSTDEDAYLVFGVPESDDAGISIWCTIQSGRAKIFLPEASSTLLPGKPAQLELIAGEVSVKLDAVATNNEEGATTSLEAEIETANPIFAAIEQSDRLKVVAGGEEQIFPLTDADVGGLLRLCRKP